MQIHVVWEPVLFTDVSEPVSKVLGLLDDPRIVQYWDAGLVVSADIVRAVNENPPLYGRDEPLPPDFIAWDVVAIFDPSAQWQRNLPPPAYYGGPVEDVLPETRKALVDALASLAVN